MPHRNQQTSPSIQAPSSYRIPKLFFAMRERLAQGYHLSDFKSDLMSGVVVAMVAIPLGMALAIASGVAPEQGLYTVIIGGIIVALCGGSRFQITGPTAAFVVVLAPIAQKYGVSGLLTAGLMAGMILLAMGIGRLGKLIQFIPYPVTTGFTSGIAVVIATLQLKDFLGLKVEKIPENYISKLKTFAVALPTFSPVELTVGISTLVLLFVWPKINKKIPAPLVVLIFISVIVVLLKSIIPEFHVETIGSRFSYTLHGMRGEGIPPILPQIHFPWNYGENFFHITPESIHAIIPSAFVIAMLGAIESLLSAVVADGMARTKHDPDSEIMALGIGNIICPFFGGIPATGAIARTATNIRYGATSPLSAVIHGIFTLLVLLVFAPYVSYLPMASLSALLLLIAYNMSEIRHFRHILRIGPKSDVIVLLLCFSLTVIFDMVVGVMVGIMLASLLFMKRMSAVTSSKILEPKEAMSLSNIPKEVMLYDINGPLFFGAAEKAMEIMNQAHQNVKAVFFLMEDVIAMDVTGLVALESAIKNLLSHHRKIYLIGVRREQRKLILGSELIAGSSNVFFLSNVDEAVQHFLPKN